MYGASEGLDTQAIDSVAFGGQASTSARIENYLGFPGGISGSELAERAALQARKFGARLTLPAEAVGLVREDGHFAVQLGTGEVVNGRTVIVATGAQYNKLDVPNLERYEGLGVYYAATQAEGQMCAGDPVIIVGAGNSAQVVELEGDPVLEAVVIEDTRTGERQELDCRALFVFIGASAVGEGSMAVALVHQRLAVT